VPDRTYLRWRMHTAYGEDDAIPSAEDVIRYARWSGKRR
jgi:type II secretory pathway predicted ATPase ExeA